MPPASPSPPLVTPARSLEDKEYDIFPWGVFSPCFQSVWHHFRNPIVKPIISASSQSAPLSIRLVSHVFRLIILNLSQ